MNFIKCFYWIYWCFPWIYWFFKLIYWFFQWFYWCLQRTYWCFQLIYKFFRLFYWCFQWIYWCCIGIIYVFYGFIDVYLLRFYWFFQWIYWPFFNGFLHNKISTKLPMLGNLSEKNTRTLRQLNCDNNNFNVYILSL